jgi:hypothetical protein
VVLWKLVASLSRIYIGNEIRGPKGQDAREFTRHEAHAPKEKSIKSLKFGALDRLRAIEVVFMTTSLP